MQTNYFKDIDSVFSELEQEQAWKTHWKTDPLKPDQVLLQDAQEPVPVPSPKKQIQPITHTHSSVDQQSKQLSDMKYEASDEIMLSEYLEESSSSVYPVKLSMH
jgi:hypothetical protein